MTVGNPTAPLAPTAAVSARAYRNAAFTTGTGFVKVPIDTVSFDPAGAIQAANGRFVCPIAGSYQVDGEVDVSATAASQWIVAALAVNGTTVTQGAAITAVGAGAIASTVADVLRLNAGDYVELWVATSGPLAITAGSSLNFLSAKG
jgi:hypothetical protein